MVYVVFHEKPGCRNNTRQKALLAAAGHTIEACDLLTAPWTVETLRPYFGDRQVAEWFNGAAPAIKDGTIDPAAQTAETALALMLADPLLIRRPLMEAGGDRRCGFDMDAVDAWIGLATPAREDVETCPRSHAATTCPAPSS